MKTKYRIVKDKYLGYEVQYKKWYWFYWGQLDFSNTFATIQEAFAFIDDCGKVVWQSDQTEVKEAKGKVIELGWFGLFVTVCAVIGALVILYCTFRIGYCAAK